MILYVNHHPMRFHIQNLKEVSNMSAIPWESMRHTWFYLPNWVSYFRIGAAWVPALLLIVAAPTNTMLQLWAVVILVALAASDGIDGFLARRLHQTSEWGMVIDPLGDKLLVAFSLLGIVVVYRWDPFALVLSVTVWLIFAREFILAAQIRIRHGKVVPPTFFGKVKTVIQFIMVGVWMLPLPGIWGAGVRWFSCSAALLITLLTWYEYYMEYVSSRWRPVKNY